MEITLNIDLEAAIAGALAPEKLQPILDKHVKDAITSAIQDATGYGSEFRKLVKTQLTAVMPHGLDVDEQVKFQHLLNGAVNDAVAGENNLAIRTAIEKSVIGLIQTIPASIKLSELMEITRDYLHFDSGAAFYAYLDQSSAGFYHLYLDSDPEPGKSAFRSSYVDREDRKYQAEYCIDFNGEGSAYSVKIKGNHITPSMLPTVVGRFESLLMSMYVGRTSILVDMDQDDVQDFAREQYND